MWWKNRKSDAAAVMRFPSSTGWSFDFRFLLHHGDCARRERRREKTLWHRSLMLRVMRVQVLFARDIGE